MSDTPTGWVCPKCGSVWAPTQNQCWTCTANPTPIEPPSFASDGTGIDPLAHKPVTHSRYTLGQHDFKEWTNNQEDKR